jgi:peptidoglycan/xylan/chitin deacetylase (PgdA/CDA1 family)
MSRFIFLFIFFAVMIISDADGADYLNLKNQKWFFRFDSSAKISVNEMAKWKPIMLGAAWQDLGFPDKKNQQRPIIGWYRCLFKLPGNLKNKNLTLRFGAIDDLDKTYLNGQLIGETGEKTPNYWSAPRNYLLPKNALKDGKNQLLVRVEDLRGKGGIVTAPFEIVLTASVSRKKTETFNPLNFQMMDIDFSITYIDAETARNSKLEKLPLPDGKQWAFTSRWDDNNRKNFRMHDLMAKYGFKGAFYLYSNYRGSSKGMNYGSDAAKKLTRDGFVIGGHSMTHPPMPYLTKNEMFYEVAAIKVEREKDSDIPIVAFAFPGGNYRSAIVPSGWPDIGEALARCGYHHNCYPSFVNAEKGISPKAVSTVQSLTADDRKAYPDRFDNRLKTILSNPRRQKENPNITWGVHVWLDEEGWANAEKIMKKYQGRPDWWYCSPNDYAAYRYMFRHSKLKKISIEANVCRYRLTVPCGADLGADVPLSFKVSGAKAVSGEAKLKEISNFGQVVDIFHPMGKRIPKLIDAVENRENKPFDNIAANSAKFPGLQTWLTYDYKAHKLRLTLKNSGSETLKDIWLDMWVPLFFKTPSRLKFRELDPGNEIVRDIDLKIAKKSPVYNAGKAYFVARLDFVSSGIPSRCYATVREKSKPVISNGPRDNAMVMIPLSEDVDLAAMSRLDYKPELNAEKNPRGWFPNSTDPERWREITVSIVPKSNKWHRAWRKKLNESPCRAAVMIDFNLDRSAEVFINGKMSESWLNGVKSPATNHLKCPAGSNRVILVYNIPKRPRSQYIILEPIDASITFPKRNCP